MTVLLSEQFPLNLPGHLSVSAVNDYITCPLRWWGSRIAKFPRPPASAPMAGSALHAAAELHHRDVDGDADPEVELLQRWKAVKPVITAERALGKFVQVDLSRSLEALALYRQRYPRQVGDSAEEPFTIKIPGVNVPFKGFMDLVTAGNLIRDIKTTGSSSWTQEKADTDLQATAYCYAFHQLTGQMPAGFEFVVLYTGVKHSVDLTVLPTTRTALHFEAFELLVKDVYDRMQLGSLKQTCPSGWCNHPESCSLTMIEQRRLLGEPEPEPKKKRERKETNEPTLRFSRSRATEGSALETLNETVQ